MDGVIKYCVVKSYQGSLIKKHRGNVHLFFIPAEGKKYMYLALVGQLTEEEGDNANAYAAQLLVRFPEDIFDDIIKGEIEYFGNRFVEVEELPCRSSMQAPGTYEIDLSKKGINLQSNLEIEYQLEYSTVGRRIYLIKGDLNLVTGEVNSKDMKMVALKQAAFMGNKSRFEEVAKTSRTGRSKIFYG